MTTQTRDLFAQIKAELDQKCPGWRTAFSSWDAAVTAAGARAKELTDEYREALRAASKPNAKLSVEPQPVVDEEDGEEVRNSEVSVGDKDVSVFDHGTCGRAVSAETSQDVLPSHFAPADADGEDRRAKVSPGRIEDSLHHPERNDTFVPLVVRPHRPPRDGAKYGNRCW